MERECFFGLMVAGTRVSTKKMSRKGWENCNGRMGEHMKESGKQDCKMELVSTGIKRESGEKVLGQKERELTEDKAKANSHNLFSCLFSHSSKLLESSQFD